MRIPGSFLTPFTLSLVLTSTASAQGLLFAATNATTGNEVVTWTRDAQGQFTLLNAFATGGTGTGTGLGSQGAVILSSDNRWLLAVNAGSNDISVFRVVPTGLMLTDTEPSLGTMPISVTMSGDLVYVLNAGVPNNVTGFTLSMNGTLTPVAGSTTTLSAASTNPAQVEFTPSGDRLVVTEKDTNLIDVFTVTSGGTLTGPITHVSAGLTPFGFGFAGTDHLIVSEAFMGNTDASALSSYHIQGGNFTTVSASIATTETAACWIAVSNNGRFVYTTNTGSDSITGYSVGAGGQLTVLTPGGVTAATGDAPTDMAFSFRSRFLYALNSMSGTISAFERNAQGALTSVGSPAGALPAGATGLAAF
jgi:6-phosphogluconolactonase (cycloisomerase 2 family)